MTRLIWTVGLGLGLGCATSGVGSEAQDSASVGESESPGGSADESESSMSSESSSSTNAGESSDSGESTSSDSSDSETDSASETGGPLTVEVVTLAYGNDPAQELDLYLPSVLPREPLPTLVLAHGGLWQSGDRSALASLCSQIVLGSGGTRACASIDYRLSQDLGGTCMGGGPDTYEGQLADFAAAFVKLQTDAAGLGLDPTRMFVGGHSAGGHLAQVLNLRWAEFVEPCPDPLECPPAIGAIGIEGIYAIAAWDAYDQAFWNGSFACATRKAFGDSPDSPQACVDDEFARPCWDVGSATYLATHAVELGIVAVGNALMIHSPGDDWVDIAEASTLGAALDSAFPAISTIVSIDGTCAVGSHNELLEEAALAACLLAFVGSGGVSL